MIYEYVCHICGYLFEARQPIKQRDCTTCPECACRADKKLSAPNFTFGFTLSDESRWVKGKKDEFVRNV